MKRIEIVQDFALPVERVFAYLAEHENLGPLFGARVERLRDGHETRNGVGSVRRLKVTPLPSFEETVTGFEVGEYVEYRITKGSPLKDHVATMRFARRGSGCTLTYIIAFRAPRLVEGVVAAGLERNIRAGLVTVDGKA